MTDNSNSDNTFSIDNTFSTDTNFAPLQATSDQPNVESTSGSISSFASSLTSSSMSSFTSSSMSSIDSSTPVSNVSNSNFVFSNDSNHLKDCDKKCDKKCDIKKIKNDKIIFDTKNKDCDKKNGSDIHYDFKLPGIKFYYYATSAKSPNSQTLELPKPYIPPSTLSMPLNSTTVPEPLPFKQKRSSSIDRFLTKLNLTLGFIAGALWSNSDKNINYISEYPLSSVFWAGLYGGLWAIPTAYVNSTLPKYTKIMLALALAASILKYAKNKI
jgi:hypothetical protein